MKLCHGFWNCTKPVSSRSVSKAEQLMSDAYTACYKQTFPALRVSATISGTSITAVRGYFGR